jgi:aldehyde dehydrogenase
MSVYAQPGQPGTVVSYLPRYDNWIGGKRVPPVKGKHFEGPTPVTRYTSCEVARGTAQDSEPGLDAVHQVAPAWGHTSITDRANIVHKIADPMEANLELLAVVQTWDNAKPVGETLAADIPWGIDHLRYFAGLVRGQESSISQIEDDTSPASYGWGCHVPSTSTANTPISASMCSPAEAAGSPSRHQRASGSLPGGH